MLFLAFLAAPIGYTLYLSFRATKVSGLGLGLKSRHEVWAGLSNFRQALSDPEFLAGVGRVGRYGLLLVPTMVALALLFALLLDSHRSRACGFSRISISLPYAVPAVIASLLWGFLYLPDVSPFVFLMQKVGITSPDILSSGGIIFAVANIALWGGTGFNMIVLYTSLKAIPVDLSEAARIDGASEIQIAWRIKIPMVMPSLVMTFIFSMIATLQVFRRADHPEAAHEHHLQHLDAADEGVPGRLHPQRHLLRRCHLLDHRGGHHSAVLRLPQDRRPQRLQPGDEPMTTIPLTAIPRQQAPAERARRASPLATAALLPGAAYCLIPVLWVLVASTKRAPELFSSFTFAPSTHLFSNIGDLSAYQGGLYWR